MPNSPDSPDLRRLRLSQLMDGELPADDVADACACWRHDAGARQDWHAYHLIGDVLRSDDLAAPPTRDEAFLQGLRQRLAKEPVPLAPALAASPTQPPAHLPPVAVGASAAGFAATAAPQAARRQRHWLVAPAAVAAGFVAVAGVMLLTRVASPDSAAPVLAAARPAAAPASAVLVRNAQLDRYLSAHRALASGAMPAAGTEQRVYIVYDGQ